MATLMSLKWNYNHSGEKTIFQLQGEQRGPENGGPSRSSQSTQQSSCDGGRRGGEAARPGIGHKAS